MQHKFQTSSGEYSAFSLGWQSYFPEYLKQQMVIFPANIMDYGSTLSKVDIYNLSVITQATKFYVLIQAATCIFIWECWSSSMPSIQVLLKEVTLCLEGLNANIPRGHN